MGKSKTSNVDPTWSHCTKVTTEKKGRLQLKCNYCGCAYWGGVFRMKHHLAGTRKEVETCFDCPEEVGDFFKKYLNDAPKKKATENCFGDEEDADVIMGENPNKGKKSMVDFVKHGKMPPKKQTLDTIWKAKEREEVCRDICRCFYASALPFNLVKDPFFKKMLNSVAEYGKGLIPPSYHEVRVSFLQKEVQTTNELVEKYKNEWKKTGCTLMSDGWSDNRNRSITNFLVNSPKGTVFLKSIDTSAIFKTAEYLFELLDSMVEEIGEENVVQVVTDSASAYVRAGELLMAKRKNLFWNPCAAHCMDLILKDIGEMPVHQDTVAKAKKITVYIYRHSWVLNFMRQYTKGKELTRPAVTRFATSYLRLHEVKISLRAMFGSEKWQKSTYAKKEDGKAVMEIVLADNNFWASIQYCLKCTLPLVKVLRLVDGDSKPPVGYIYEAMDKAKEQIAENFKGVEKRYKCIWKIIDRRWDMQLHSCMQLLTT